MPTTPSSKTARSFCSWLWSSVFDSQELATAHRSDPRDDGLTFHAMLFNAQWMRTGGDGWILLLEFQPDNQTVQLRTYSPYLNAWRTGPEYDYVLDRSR